jgi:purine-binding chemotaxis protein CheW
MGATARLSSAARVPEGTAEAMEQGKQYLTFSVSGETFAIGISAIKEIIEYRAPTDVPMMPTFIRGVINLRGRVVPVVDLSVRFGRSPMEVVRRTCIVILEVQEGDERQEIGAVVDAVSAVVDIPEADIEPPPQFGARLRADFIGGMGKLGEKFVILLNVDRVLSVEELATLGGIVEDAEAASAPHGAASQ